MLLWAYHSLRGSHLQFNLSGRVIVFQLYCKTFAPITTNPWGKLKENQDLHGIDDDTNTPRVERESEYIKLGIIGAIFN